MYYFFLLTIYFFIFYAIYSISYFNFCFAMSKAIYFNNVM